MSAHDHATTPPADEYLSRGRGLGSWLGSLDHKRIAVTYLVCVLIAFLIGGILGLMESAELLGPDRVLMDGDEFARTSSLHGAIMIFLVAVPAIPAVLGNFVLPLMLGAGNTALPRVNRAGLHLYIVGAVLLVGAIAVGEPGTGWSVHAVSGDDLGAALLAGCVLALGLSIAATALNLLLTVTRMRPAGMGWPDLPLMAWSLAATSVVQLVVAVFLFVLTFVTVMERISGTGVFVPALGGDAVLHQHLFWFTTHSALAVAILPAVGVVSEIIAVFSRKPIFGHRATVYAVVGTAVFSLVAWGRHLVAAGQSDLWNTVFSALALLGAVPLTVIVFNWLCTLYKGSIRPAAPMLYALAFLVLFGVGGLSGLFLSTLAVSTHLAGTAFASAHVHYFVFGGVFSALLAGLHYWWPKMFGRMVDDRGAAWGAVLTTVGFNLAFFPQFVAGGRGLTNAAGDLRIVALAGGAVLAIGFVVVASVLVRSLAHGPAAPANPWGGATLEWRTTSPPPAGNFAHPPAPADPYDLASLRYDPDLKGYRGPGTGI